MKKTKLQKGITLIALIITIVVLLILAVVTIGAVQESEIIAHAQNAASNYNQKQATENSILKEYDDYITSQVTTKKTWEYAWVSRNGIWDEEAITDQAELPMPGKDIIIASFYKTGNKIKPKTVQEMVWNEGNEYHLVIEGTGEMGDLMIVDDNGEFTGTAVAWMKQFFLQVESHILPYVTNVTIADGINNLGAGLLYCASSIKEINIPSSVISIGDMAFGVCLSLSKIKIPNGIKTIEGHAFVMCESLTEIEIPYSVDTIRNYAFGSCVSLEKVKIYSENIEAVGDGIFEDIAGTEENKSKIYVLSEEIKEKLEGTYTSSKTMVEVVAKEYMDII